MKVFIDWMSSEYTSSVPLLSKFEKNNNLCHDRIEIKALKSVIRQRSRQLGFKTVRIIEIGAIKI